MTRMLDINSDEHYHCPLGCEHPQPLKAGDGKEYCGRCWFKDDKLTEMVKCTPETCPGE